MFSKMFTFYTTHLHYNLPLKEEKNTVVKCFFLHLKRIEKYNGWSSEATDFNGVPEQ